MIRHYKLVGSITSLRSSCASPTPGFLFCLVRSCSPRCNACRGAELSRKGPETREKGQPALLHAVLGFIYFVMDPVCVGKLCLAEQEPGFGVGLRWLLWPHWGCWWRRVRCTGGGGGGYTGVCPAVVVPREAGFKLLSFSLHGAGAGKSTFPRARSARSQQNVVMPPHPHEKNLSQQGFLL